MILYDIRTSLLLPGAKNTEFVKILVNLEAQKEDTPGYDLPLRGIFYCSRMISAQLGTEFTNNADDPVKYGNLKKVYSIWICTNTAQCRANVIEKYRLNRQVMVGMTTYTAAIKSDSRAEGYKLGEAKKLIQMVNNLMESMPFDEALRIMKVTNEEYEAAKELLEQDKTLNR